MTRIKIINVISSLMRDETDGRRGQTSWRTVQLVIIAILVTITDHF